MRRRGIAVSVALVVAVTLGVWSSFSFDAGEFNVDAISPMVVTARGGEVLRRVARGGRPGRERFVRLSEIPPEAISILVVSEDKNFYEHSGIDGKALLRSAWLSLTSGRLYGGSTLSMQLARIVYFPSGTRSLWRKLKQMRVALAIEHHLSKEEILEHYLNRVYFGHGAYGIEAAAQIYFGKSASALTIAEAGSLMVLPRGPAFYDPFRHPERLRERRAVLFAQLRDSGRVSASDIERAAQQEPVFSLHPSPWRAPHFVDSFLARSDRQRSGLARTTIDLPLQTTVEGLLRAHVHEAQSDNVQDGAVVVLDASTGEILVMVGGANYRESELNLATWPRPPGSTLKPFVYATAFEAGAAPSSTAFDIYEASGSYVEGGQERGLVSYRTALASSLNFAAMDVLESVGGAAVNGLLQKAHLRSDSRPPVGGWSRVALGSTPVPLLALAASYRSFLFAGRMRSPVWTVGSPGAESEVMSEATAWQVMDVLSDSEARRLTFGEGLAVDFDFPIVAKTGTALGFSDTWAVFASREVIIAVWQGRRDGASVGGIPGMRGPAVLARQVLLSFMRNERPTLPPMPESVTYRTVCALSGGTPHAGCPSTTREVLARGAVVDSCELHRADGSVAWPERLRPWRERHGGASEK